MFRTPLPAEPAAKPCAPPLMTSLMPACSLRNPPAAPASNGIVAPPVRNPSPPCTHGFERPFWATFLALSPNLPSVPPTRILGPI